VGGYNMRRTELIHAKRKKNIFANEIKIGKNVKISPNVEIICDKISIGNGTVIVGYTKINCKECIIGKNNFFNSILIEGSLNAGNTKIKIGNENLILQNTRLNCNDYLEIWDDVNIGQYVSIWTHASSMNVLNGYPFNKSPVKISSHVWITAGTTILPGVEIGSHVIIGNSSVVNKNIPDGSFAAGAPVRIIKENVFPKKLTLDEKKNILENCIKEYKKLLQLKSFSAKLKIINKLSIEFSVDDKKTIFDCNNKEIKGELTRYAEDFRDFLRYRGIKFFTDKSFKSILPIWYVNAIKDNRKKRNL
jgi:acetyltransferase-like isoleucine patch superfamily enzyme